MARMYQKQANSHFYNRIAYSVKNHVPIYIIKLETTGLDPETDTICGITAIKCEPTSSGFAMIDKYATLVKGGKLIPDETSKVSGITNEIVDKIGINEEQMVNELYSFLGKDAIMTGFSTKRFIYPFLKKLFDKYNKDIPIKGSFDLSTIAKAVFESRNSGYGARVVAELCSTTYTPEGFVTILNKLATKIPKGKEVVNKGFITDSRYKEYSHNNAYIYFKTRRGTVALNARTLYWEETRDCPNYFDRVNMDSLTDYLLSVTKSANMYEASMKLRSKLKVR